MYNEPLAWAATWTENPQTSRIGTCFGAFLPLCKAGVFLEIFSFVWASLEDIGAGGGSSTSTLSGSNLNFAHRTL